MCDLCQKAKSVAEYGEMISKMHEQDKARVEQTKVVAPSLSPITKSCYTSMAWPIKFVQPMFDARMAFAVPNNYFQNIVLDDERLGNSFAHGSMRSVFFVDERLVVLSKAVNFKDGKEFFTSFLLIHLERNEYDAKIDNEGIMITARLEKPMLNLVTGKTEQKRIVFSFMHQPVKGRLVSKEQAAASSTFKAVYAKHGTSGIAGIAGAQLKSASIDMEGYAVTVPHFSPHPYMLQLSRQFGYPGNMEFQLHADEYFKAHLTR